jgi:four helix bundle protein
VLNGLNAPNPGWPTHVRQSDSPCNQHDVHRLTARCAGSISIPLNIAERYGKRSEADRSRSYDIARGSAHECAAVLNVARILKLLDDGTLVRGKQ